MTTYDRAEYLRLRAVLDALAHLSPVHPERQAALDALWYFVNPDWHYEPTEADCDPGF